MFKCVALINFLIQLVKNAKHLVLPAKKDIPTTRQQENARLSFVRMGKSTIQILINASTLYRILFRYVLPINPIGIQQATNASYVQIVILFIIKFIIDASLVLLTLLGMRQKVLARFNALQDTYIIKHQISVYPYATIMKFTILVRNSARSNVLRVRNIMQHLNNASNSVQVGKFTMQLQKYVKLSVLIKHFITNLVNRVKFYALQDKYLI